MQRAQLVLRIPKNFGAVLRVQVQAAERVDAVRIDRSRSRLAQDSGERDADDQNVA